METGGEARGQALMEAGAELSVTVHGGLARCDLVHPPSTPKEPGQGSDKQGKARLKSTV